MNSRFWMNIASVLSGTAVAQAIPILGSLVLARLFVPAAYGGYAVWLGAVLIIAVITTLRLEMALAVVLLLARVVTGNWRWAFAAALTATKDANSFVGPSITCDKTVMPGNSACHAGLLFFQVQDDLTIKTMTPDFVHGVL